MNETLKEKLVELNKSDMYPFHMPGHKRRQMVDNGYLDQVSHYDITEITGFDNLHHPEEILKKEQEKVARLYGAKKSYFLVNGSSSGVLIAISALAKENETILLQRNSHKSAYNACYLRKLKTEFLYAKEAEEFGLPQGDIEIEELSQKLQATKAKVVFITSPSYEGIVNNIEEIAKIVHDNGALLIVDEAHGAHFGFHEAFPKSAITCGADIVIQSLHKTMPALTQSALLHICSDRVNRELVERFYSMYQTSSPSYVLLSSMSSCTHYIEENETSLFENYYVKLKNFYEKTKDLQNLYVLDSTWSEMRFGAPKDPSKIVIVVPADVVKAGASYNGKKLFDELRTRFHLELEMASTRYALAMTSICDTQSGFNRLVEALFVLDRELSSSEKREKASELSEITSVQNKIENEFGAACNYTEKKLEICEAMESEMKSVSFEEAIGCISGEFIYLYPPGSPIIVPGEIFSKEKWELVQQYIKQGLSVQGPSDYTLQRLRVLG